MSFNSNSRMTSSHVTTLMTNRRKSEARTKDLATYAATTVTAAHNNQKSDALMERRRANTHASHAAEAMLSDTQAKEDVAAASQTVTRDTTHALSQALRDHTRQSDRQSRKIQAIVDSSEELKELQAALNVAYMSKERAGQQTTAAALAAEAATRESAMDAAMAYDRARAEADAINQERRRAAANVEAKQHIQQQMMDRVVAATEAANDAAADKDTVDAIMRRIAEEEAASREARVNTRNDVRRHIEEARAARALEKQRAAEAEAAADAQVAAYASQVATRQAGVQVAADAKKAREEAAFRAVEKKLAAAAAEEAELQALRDGLWTEEMHLSRQALGASTRARKMKEREAMMATNASQLARKAADTRADQLAETAYNDALRSKYAAEKVADAQAREALRQKQATYQETIVAQQLAKKAVYGQALAQEQEAAEAAAEEARFSAEVIAQAKATLLAAHATALDGYLPKGAGAGAPQR